MHRQGRLDRRLCFSALVAAGVVSPVPLWAQDTDERVRQLEERLQAVTEELHSIKQMMREDRDARAVGKQEPAAAAAKRAQDDAAEASGQAAELKDRVQALEQRVDQAPQGSFGNGLGLQDPRGRWGARFTGRVQADYRYYDPADAIPSTFSVRRARIGLEVTAYKDYVFYVEGEFITGNPQGGTTQGASLTNAYLDLNWFRQARPRLGQFKPPIGLENSAPDVLTDFMERSLTNSLLQNLNYDRGIMVQGVPYKGIYYGVSLTNGAGLNLEERNTSAQDVGARGKDVTARLAVDFAQYLNFADSVVHVGGGYKTGQVPNSPTSGFVAATSRTEGFGTTFFTPQAFNGVTGATQATNVDRRISVGELALAWKQFKLQSEIWKAHYSGTRLAPGPAVPWDRDMDAYYVAAFWMLTGEAYADAYGGNATFGRIKPRNNFSFEKGGGWGAWELGLRFSSFDASDFAATNPAATGRPGATAPTTVSTSKADAWTFMVKWLLNPNVRLLLNYVETDFDTPVTTNGVVYGTEKAITFRGQFDF
jgi:phosphate-selective porin OprO and OprP